MGLGREQSELSEVWNEVLGRYDTAMLKLVMDVLQECQNPEEKLSNALSKMPTSESTSQASQAIQKGTYVCTGVSCIVIWSSCNRKIYI